jgi:hypothetical protein
LAVFVGVAAAPASGSAAALAAAELRFLVDSGMRHFLARMVEWRAGRP